MRDVETKARRWDRLIEFYKQMEVFSGSPTIKVDRLMTHSHGRYKFAKEFIDVFDRVFTLIVCQEE